MVSAPVLLYQDTTVVRVARDSLATASSWTLVGLALAFLLILIVLVLLLIEFRKLSRQWQTLLTTVSGQSGPLLDHANTAARNVEYITQVVRTDVDRLGGAVSGLADGLESASLDVQGRLRDMSALLDLAQSEAEDAVLDAATRVRALRSGAGRLASLRRERPSDPGEPADEPAPEEPDDG